MAMSQEQLGQLLGVSRRTVIRWGEHGVSLSRDQKAALVEALHAKDPAFAAQIAGDLGESLESLGVVAVAVASPEPSRAEALPAPIAREHLADSIVCAAAEAVGLSPQAVRPALVAAFDRAASVRLSLDDVRAALAPKGDAATR
jgi:hypothetical protein